MRDLSCELAHAQMADHGEVIVHTYSGRAVDLLNPDPATIELTDIAHSLSKQCRFNGHTKGFYSVAEHSWRGAWLAAGHGFNAQREFLLHDAAEAYIGDIATPFKRLIGPAVQAIESGLIGAIYARFEMGPVDGEALHRIDRMMLALEAARFLKHPLKGEWPPQPARLPEHGMTDWGQEPEEACRFFMRWAEKLGVL